MIDVDGTNILDKKEVVLYLKSITDNLADEHIAAVFYGVETDEDTSLDFTKFKVFCIPRNFTLIRVFLSLGVLLSLSSYMFQNLLNEISTAGWVQVGIIDRKEINIEEVQTLFSMIDKHNIGFLTIKVNCFAHYLCKLNGNFCPLIYF